MQYQKKGWDKSDRLIFRAVWPLLYLLVSASNQATRLRVLASASASASSASSSASACTQSHVDLGSHATAHTTHHSTDPRPPQSSQPTGLAACPPQSLHKMASTTVATTATTAGAGAAGPSTPSPSPTTTATATAAAAAPIHPYKEVLAGSVAAVASTLVCHPIDVLRTELQTQARPTTARACLRRIGASSVVLCVGVCI